MCLIKSFGHWLLNDAFNALNFVCLKFCEILENDIIVNSLIERILKTYDSKVGKTCIENEKEKCFIGFAHREETTHLCRIWTWG